MSRWDTTGLFWDDYVAPRVAKEKVKREPPEPIWLKPDYLPGLEEARAYNFDLLTGPEILAAANAKERFVWDIETYPNYTLFGFRSIESGKTIKFELLTGEKLEGIEHNKFEWCLRNLTVIGFNDTNFDIPIAVAILAGKTTLELALCANALINGGDYGTGMTPRDFYKEYKLKPLFIDHIDLLELTPLGPSLKISAGRIHAPRMADLPFPAGTYLSEDQITIVRWYWSNDLDNTKFLYFKHKTAIELREILTKEYKVDVRSKSDPQIAEAVISAEIKRITGQKFIKRATIEPGRQFSYRAPGYVKYSSPTLKWVYDFIHRQVFTVDAFGSPTESDELKQLTFVIGGTSYNIGIGGLHSQEKKMIHIADEHYELSDNDVTSYYPSLMIQQGMYPPNVGPAFLQVFKRIYDRRLAAKAAGDKDTAETLKIVLNGTFGKTGERGGHSVVYYPEMMIQVTLTGQLSLLMLIEALELAGIQVISANTDGVTVKCPRHLLEVKKQIMTAWEQATGLGLESKNFKAVYARDVNNYIALLEKPDEKVKDGFKYAKSIGAYRKITDAYPLKWNPTCDICAEAVIVYLATGKSVDETIRECTDMRKFVEVRRVNGGAFKDGEYLGKAIRWYYSSEAGGPIVNAKNGNFVPRSVGARPCMVMPETIPSDIDYTYYVERALSMLDNFEQKDKLAA
ncbi:DNA polymerase protein [Rhizobium phage RHph_N17]|nr:DNA polymerase protein [Rhizobium phage RHph_N17]